MNHGLSKKMIVIECGGLGDSHRTLLVIVVLTIIMARK